MTDQEQIDEIKRLRAARQPQNELQEAIAAPLANQPDDNAKSEIDEINRLRAEKMSSETVPPTIKRESSWTERTPPIGSEIPVIGPLGKAMGEGFRAGVEGTFGPESYGDAYSRIRNEDARMENRYAQENPITDIGKRVGGAVILGPGGAGPVTRIATNTGINALDSYLHNANSEEALQSGKIGAGIQGVIEATPYVGRVAAPVLRPIANSMENFAGSRAIKHIYGNYAKYLKEVPAAEKIAQGISAIKNGVVRFGERAGKTARRADEVGNQAWDKVQSVFDTMANQGKVIPGADIANKIETGTGKLLDIPGYNPIRQRLAEEADYYRYQKLPEGAEGPRMERSFTPEEVQARKNKYRYKLTDPLTAPLGQEGTNIVNRSLGTSIKDSVQGMPGAEGFKDAYNLAGQAGHWEKGAKYQDMMTGKNRSFSPSDYFSAGMGGVAGAVLTGDPRDATTTAVLMGVANRLMRGRGNAALASTFYNVAQAIGSKPGQTVGVLRRLETGALGGPIGREAAAEIRHRLMLQSQEP